MENGKWKIENGKLTFDTKSSITNFSNTPLGFFLCFQGGGNGINMINVLLNIDWK